jgi:hypothetical protein
MAIFDEHYRVVAVNSERLTIQGIVSGKVLVINAEPYSPIQEGDYPPGKLIVLTDPSAAQLPN